jgi:uncharacterized membrane protein YdbT with pleckstrin-like domain
MPDDAPPPIQPLRTPPLPATGAGTAAAGTTPAEPEQNLWTGHTSQWVHFWYYFFCVLLALGAIAGMPFTQGLSGAALIIPLVMWIIRWWVTRTTSYELTSQRLKIHHGILTRRLEELELYRVKDYVMEQPLMLRLLGLGNLTLVSSDASTPRLMIRAIPDVATVRERLRTAVQSERDRKRVRELDVDNLST